MKNLREKYICVIDITNHCNSEKPGCLYCSRFMRHIPKEKKYNMSLEFFEKTLLSLKNWPNQIGIIGGEPSLHPKLLEMIDMIKQIFPNYKQKFAFLTSGSPIFEKHKELIYNTFRWVAYNPHDKNQKEICLHQRATMTSKDVIPDEILRDKLINNCWVDKTWGPGVNPRGGYFCEIAAAISLLLDGPNGVPIENNWWNRPLEDFKYQVDFCCQNCGMSVPQERDIIGIKKEKFSKGNYELYKNLGLKSMEDEWVEIVDKTFTTEEIEKNSINWTPGNYRQDLGEK